MTPPYLLSKRNLIMSGFTLLVFQFASAQFNQQWVRTWDDSLHQNNTASTSVIDHSGNIILAGVTYDALFSPVDIRVVKYDPSGNLQWMAKYLPAFANFLLTAEPAVDNADNIYLAVDVYDNVNTHHIMNILKYDSSGNLTWNKSYTWPTGFSGFPAQSKKVFLDAAGNIYVGSTQDNPGGGFSLGGRECSIVKFDSQGNYISEMRTGDPFSQPTILIQVYSNYCMDVDITSGQHIYSITDIQQDSVAHPYDETTDFAVQKHDTGGSRVFISKIYRSATDDIPGDMFIGNFENIFVTGETTDTSAGIQKSRYLTARLDSSGNILYVAERGDTSWHSEGKAIVADALGFAYVAGYTTQFGTGDIELVKYGPNGNEIWNVNYNSPFNNYDEPTQIVFDANDNLLISAACYNGSNYDALLLKYDTAGTLLDSARYNSTHNLDDYGKAIFDNTGQLYLTGSTQHPANSSDYLLIKYGSLSAVNELNNSNGFNVYPNPASQTAVIDLHTTEKSTITLVILDVMGKVVWRSEISRQKSEIDLNDFESGIYFIRVSSEHDIVTQKLIVQR